MAQRLHGQVHLAALNLQRRIFGQRRLHFLTQGTLTCLDDLHLHDLHDMGLVYRSRSQRSNFLLSVFRRRYKCFPMSENLQTVGNLR